MSLLDLMRPLWKHSNPQKRIAAIAQLGSENQSIFSALACKDSDPEVRKAALRRVHDSQTLSKVMQNDERADIRQLAQNRFEEDLTRELKSWSDGDMAELDNSLQKIQESRYLEELARNALSAQVRIRAAQRNPRPGVLLHQALRDEDVKVAQIACDQITREKDIQEVAGNSRHPSVRQSASARSREARQETRTNDRQELDLRKREALIVALKRCVENRDPLSVESEAQVLVEEARRLGIGQDTEIIGLAESLNTKCAGLRQELAQKELAKQHAEEVRCLATQSMEQVEAIVNEGLALQKEVQARALLESLQGLSLSSDLARRVEQVNARFLRQLEVDQENKSTAEQQREHRQSVIDQLKLLLERQDSAQVEKQFKGLIREWEQIAPADSGDPFLHNYIALRDELNSSLLRVSESRQHDYQIKIAKLQALIDLINGMDENQDFREISRILRTTYHEWKSVVGDEKYQFQSIWKEYRKATARFEELKEWESWHNERDRELLIEEAESLAALEPGIELMSKVRNLQASWKTVGHVSQSRIQELWERFHAACDLAMNRCRPWMEQQDVARQQNLNTKETLCAELESIVADLGEGWKEKSKRVQKIQEDWKATGPVPREFNQVIWDRFRTVCDSFYNKHKEYLRQEDTERQSNLNHKLSLCEQAEALRDSTDWNGTTQKLKRLQDEWKNSGPVPKSQSEAVWHRFREACDSFFENKRKHFEELDAGKISNFQKKAEICDRLTSLLEQPLVAQVITEFEESMRQWHQSGMVPKDQVDLAWEQFNKVVDRFEQLRAESDPLMAKELANRLVAKQAMVVRVRELCENPGSVQSSDAVKGLQEEWRKIGRAGAGEAEVYAEFRKVCDEFFALRRDQFEIQEQARQNNLTRKQLLCEQAERLLASSPDVRSLEEVKHLRRLWKEVGPVPREISDKIWKRFNGACDSVFTAVRGENTVV